MPGPFFPGDPSEEDTGVGGDGGTPPPPNPPPTNPPPNPPPPSNPPDGGT
jgi:hypothetical protein